MGAENVEMLRVVGGCKPKSLFFHVNQSISAVRETLSEDLVERLIIDILEIAESLTSRATAFNSLNTGANIWFVLQRIQVTSWLWSTLLRMYIQTKNTDAHKKRTLVVRRVKNRQGILGIAEPYEVWQCLIVN